MGYLNPFRFPEATPSQQYEVEWATDLDADTPREAAQAALDVILSTAPGGLARVFTVTAEDGTVTTIDLSLGAGITDVDLSTDTKG